MSSAGLPSAIQRPDWIWHTISMLKRPSFICELLTDSGYHLCNCSVYWSQSQQERGGGGSSWKGGSWRKIGREGLWFKKGGCRNPATSLYISIWYGWDPMQRAGNSLFEYVFLELHLQRKTCIKAETVALFHNRNCACLEAFIQGLNVANIWCFLIFQPKQMKHVYCCTLRTWFCTCRLHVTVCLLYLSALHHISPPVCAPSLPPLYTQCFSLSLFFLSYSL